MTGRGKRARSTAPCWSTLPRSKPIELLADRREETVTAWLLTHPEIEVISRDRGGEYAAAAKKAAPQAQQIADKFHLLLNLREKLKELMARKQKLLPHVEPTTLGTIPASCAVEIAKSFRHMSPHLRVASSGSAPLPPEETPSQISRFNRFARYETVRTLQQQAPQLLANLEWRSAYYHVVRPHESLRVAFADPRKRGSKRLA